MSGIIGVTPTRMHDGRGRPSDDPGPRSGGSFFFETSRERRVRCGVSQSPVRVSAKHFHISPPDIMYVFPVFLDMYILTLYNACACDVPWWMTEFCFLASREKNALPFAVGTKKKCNDTIVISSKRRAMATVQNLRFFCTWFCGRRKDAARNTQNHLIRVFGPSLQQKMSIKSVWPFGRSSYVDSTHFCVTSVCGPRTEQPVVTQKCSFLPEDEEAWRARSFVGQNGVRCCRGPAKTDKIATIRSASRKRRYLQFKMRC